MFVYGVRCAPADLPDLPDSAIADYYLDYGLLVFSNYTRASCLQNYGRCSPQFWSSVQRIISNTDKPSEVTVLEQPFISPGEDEVIQALRQAYPGLQSTWYYVPHVVWTSPDDLPAIQVSDLAQAPVSESAAVTATVP